MEFLKKRRIAVEGTTEQVADQLISRFIAPAADEMKKVDKSQADFFTFLVAGKTISGHLATLETIDIDEAATALKQTIDGIVSEIKKDRLLRNPASKKKS